MTSSTPEDRETLKQGESSLEEGMRQLATRQKHIKITDQSDFGHIQYRDPSWYDFLGSSDGYYYGEGETNRGLPTSYASEAIQVRDSGAVFPVVDTAI